MFDSRSQVKTARRLADRLAQARKRRFVGRQEEVTLFQRALNLKEPPVSVLHVYGPGGIGKTTLIGEFARLAQESGYQTVRLDGRNMEASPPGFLLTLTTELGIAENESPLQALGDDWRGVIFIDTYELLLPLDDWLRDAFLPQLPENSLVVIAGRDYPPSEWSTDPGWSELVRLLPLRNLSPDESRGYLTARGIDEDMHQSVLDLTYGHPLALSLFADVVSQGDGSTDVRAEGHPDIVGTLVERFLSLVPSARHRNAIEISAHARMTTETLLASVFGEAAGHELFAWLRGLSFMEQCPEGLFPHDLARDVIDADVRWRDPERYWRIHNQVRRPVIERLQQSQGIEQQRAFFDLLFLHRNSQFMTIYDWNALGTAYAETANAQDFHAIIDLIRRYESEESARIAEYWIERRPDSFIAFRTQSENMIGFACGLLLDEVTDEDLAVDPGARAAWEYAEHHGSLRPGEQIIIARFEMNVDGPEHLGATANVSAGAFVTGMMSNPRVAWSFIQTPFPEFWHDSLVYMDQYRTPEADFEVGGVHYSVYTHDWRAEPVVDWLQTMSRREIATHVDLSEIEANRPASVVVLSKPAFEDAVRRALRDYTRPNNLAKSPLMRSRLVTTQAGETAPPDRLQRLIREAAETLRGTPKDERFYRAIRRTYLEPAATQELAAESLGLPFSTYRYHLSNGVARITTWLWERELNLSDDEHRSTA